MGGMNMGEGEGDRTRGAITELLGDWVEGEPDALAALAEVVVDELRAIAARIMSAEGAVSVLQPTALVNELYIRLSRRRTVTFTNRAHFFGFAAQAMRRILVDAARKRRAAKRGGGRRRVELERDDEFPGVPPDADVDLLALDHALERLGTLDPRQARVVELRFFTGLEFVEIADMLGVSPATVYRDWATARVWLYRELSDDP